MIINFSLLSEAETANIGKALNKFNIENKILIVKNKDISNKRYTPKSCKSAIYKSLIAIEQYQDGTYEILRANKKKRFDRANIQKTTNKYNIKKILLENQDKISIYDFETKVLADDN